MEPQNSLIDSYGRRITYLRISLTDRCNFRCFYCTPANGFSLLPKSEILTRAEIVRFVRVISRLGVCRIRLTGGEPLLREDILDIVRDIKVLGTVSDLSITTNGSLLAPMAKPLKAAGLDRLNVSLDSVDANRFLEITGSNAYRHVREGIRLALEEGFSVKLNMVVLRSVSEEEIAELVRLAERFQLEVRFLEFMPLCGSNWRIDQFVPIREIRELVERNFQVFLLPPSDDTVAQVYKIAHGRGSVGFIASVTESFCGRCSRIRLSSDGKIFPCLFSNIHISIKELLRNGAGDGEVAEKIRDAVWMKPEGNAFRHGFFDHGQAEMYQTEASPLIRGIGG
ncbi:MAG: GTP 3',8-cyclase MoaA [Candidatus Omnitrophica bacterium]|nr:GTP 3',8-cyclase MoaA [Candidatus Omnitrophota bacterium]